MCDGIPRRTEGRRDLGDLSGSGLYHLRIRLRNGGFFNYLLSSFPLDFRGYSKVCKESKKGQDLFPGSPTRNVKKTVIEYKVVYCSSVGKDSTLYSIIKEGVISRNTLGGL